MGCCMNSNVEASLDLIVTEKDKPSESDDDFVEVYLPNINPNCI